MFGKSLNDWQSAIDINLTGMMLCIQAELRAIARPGGSIVNLSSASGVRGFPKASGYCASKHGVIGLTSAAAAEYGRQGVRINAVCP
jgi:NAD(P)-dependent dehydrogenase (short-subunit alcohol dehydrogenase family)